MGLHGSTCRRCNVDRDGGGVNLAVAMFLKCAVYGDVDVFSLIGSTLRVLRDGDGGTLGCTARYFECVL